MCLLDIAVSVLFFSPLLSIGVYLKTDVISAVYVAAGWLVLLFLFLSNVICFLSVNS